MGRTYVPPPTVRGLSTGSIAKAAAVAVDDQTPAGRSRALAALRPRVGLLVVAEFHIPDIPDVPDVRPGTDEHLDLLACSDDQGLAEHDGDRDLVAQGFLMPVLTGQLAPGAVRATWEQPAAAWADQLRDAGYRDVAVTPWPTTGRRRRSC